MTQYFYLIHIQYLGYRYHGWMKQPGVKTIESMLDKTTAFILGNASYKLLGASRTDTMVSANHSVFELFTNTKFNTSQLQTDYNINLPNDIKVINIQRVDKHFNIINTPRIKEYVYLFAFGEKCHPFSAPFISSFSDKLNIDLMKQGAALFQGTHSFARYCTKPGPKTHFHREVLLSKIEANELFQASFFPETSYAYHIHAKGFLRYQVRLIMGQLLSLGRGESTLSNIKDTLQTKTHSPLRHIAPAAGLILNKIRFETDPEHTD